jgi:hypothetical protein
VAGEAESPVSDAAGEVTSTWLLRWIARLLLLVGALVGVLGVVYGWPVEKLGNAYQLLGLAIAALGVPVVAPGLGRAEVAVGKAKQAGIEWIRRRGEQLKRMWARVFRRGVTVELKGGAAAASGGGATVTVGHRSVDRETIGDRQWLAFLNDEVDALRERVRSVEQARSADAVERDRRLEGLRVELQRHALSVTREGWHYILSGAGTTAIGISLTLLA